MDLRHSTRIGPLPLSGMIVTTIDRPLAWLAHDMSAVAPPVPSPASTAPTVGVGVGARPLGRSLWRSG
eukprot:scaffold771_cov387-Prasinococcus_capsulatus_cf.AAC.2